MAEIPIDTHVLQGTFMKNILLLLLVALGLSAQQLQAKKEFSFTKDLCCNFKPLPAPAVLHNITTIEESGTYQLTKDTTSNIVIAANDVCLDLNGFTLTNSFNTSVISASNRNNITIKNGTITTGVDTAFGINLIGCNQISLSNLEFFTLKHALSLSNCTNACLSNIDASNNVINTDQNNRGPIISISGGHTFTLSHINVSDCIVTRMPSAATPLVIIQGVDNLTMKCSQFNGNICKDIFPLTILFVDGSNTIIIEDTEINDTKVVSTTIPAAPSQGLVSAQLGSNAGNTNVCLRRCKFNRSYADLTSICFGLLCVNTNHLLIEDCEANDTKIATKLGPVPAPGNNSGASGIVLRSITDFKVCHTNANGTSHQANVSTSGQNVLSGPEGIFLNDCRDGKIEHCKTNRTQSLESGLPFAFGTLIFNSHDICVDACEANETTASSLAVGFACVAPNTNITIRHSQSNKCAASGGQGVGFLTIAGVVSGQINEEIYFENNCAHANTGSEGIGFIITGNAQNCTITGSSAKNNFSAGIKVGGINNIINPKIIQNCVQHNGTGILLNSTGVPITNALVFENKAIKNTNCGFQEVGTPTTPTTYVGNLAQGNGTDFCIPTTVEVLEKKGDTLTCKAGPDECHFGNLVNISVLPTHNHKD